MSLDKRGPWYEDIPYAAERGRPSEYPVLSLRMGHLEQARLRAIAGNGRGCPLRSPRVATAFEGQALSLAPGKAPFIRRSHNHFNNLHVKSPREIIVITTCAAEHSLMCCVVETRVVEMLVKPAHERFLAALQRCCSLRVPMLD